MASGEISSNSIAEALKISDGNLLASISKSLSRYNRNVYECRRCVKKFLIPNARDNAIYKCRTCSAIVERPLLESVGQTELVLDEAIPPAIQDALKDSSRVFGRFVLFEVLPGATGLYRAFDLELGRFIALKISSEDLPTRNLAALDHHNIAKVYDAGTLAGKSYVARQFVEGTVLDEYKESAIEILAAVAGAVAYAHRMGIIHGSLGGQTVIVDAAGNPLVINFGEVRGKTTTDDIRSLQLMLRGRFTDDHELAAIRDADYSSADVLADDLQNYISGRPVRAYSTGLFYAGRKLVARHKRMSTAVSVSIAALVTAAVFLVSRERERQKEEQISLENQRRVEAAALEKKAAVEIELAQKERIKKMLDALLKDIAGAHEEALARRRQGDSRVLLAKIPERLLSSTFYSQVRKEADSSPDVKYSFGKIYKTIGDDKTASEYFSTAVSLKPDFGPALYELGFLAMKSYLRLLVERKQELLIIRSQQHVSSIRDRGAPLPTKPDRIHADELENEQSTTMRKEGMTKLQSALNSLSTEQVEGSLAEALLLFFSGKKEFALQKFLKVYAIDAGSEDAVEFLSEMYADRREYERSTEVLDGAIAVDRGNVSFLFKRANILDSIAFEFDSRGEDPMPSFNSAVKDLETVMSLAPEFYEAESLLGSIFLHVATHVMNQAKDPSEPFASALKSLDLAAKLRPDSAAIYTRRAMVNVTLGYYLNNTGGDPRKSYSDAIQDFDRALKINARSWETWQERAGLLTNIAVYKMDRGIDSSAEFADAEESVKKAIELNSTQASVWRIAGNMQSNWAILLQNFGRDADERYNSAILCYDNAIKLQPDQYSNWLYRAHTYSNWAYYRVHYGGDAIACIEKGLADAEQALKLNSNDFSCWNAQAVLWQVCAAAKMQRGQNSEQAFRNAIHSYTRAVEINPGSADAVLWRGSAHMGLGAILAGSGRKPDEEYALALKDSDRAIELNPNEAEAWVNRAGVLMNIGLERQHAGDDPAEWYHKALQDYEAALKKNERNYEIYMWRGTMYFNWALHKIKVNEDPEEEFANSHADFKKAAELNPANSQIWEHAARMLKSRALHCLSIGKRQEGIAHLTSSIDAVDRAMKLNPNGASRLSAEKKALEEKIQQAAGDY